MKPARLQKLVDSLQLLANAVKSDSKIEDSIYKEMILFSTDLKIFRVFLGSETSVTSNNKFSKTLKSIGPVTEYFYANKQYDWTDKHSMVQINYFLKQEYNRAWSTGYMAPAPMSAAANWRGVGYYTINFPGDTLFFQHPTNYHEDLNFTQKKPYYENNESGKLDLFKIPGFSFTLITVGYDTDFTDPLDGCYVVKSN